MTEDEQRPQGISRRTVSTTAAWSVPVIALAAITPSAAASVPAQVITVRLTRTETSVFIEFYLTQGGQPVAGGMVHYRIVNQGFQILPLTRTDARGYTALEVRPSDYVSSYERSPLQAFLTASGQSVTDLILPTLTSIPRRP